MKPKNIMHALVIGGLLLYSTTSIQADEEYAKVLFDIPETNLKICAHYTKKPNELRIVLYEANADNIKNNMPVGYIICNTRKFTHDDPAYIEMLYIYPEGRKKNYGRIVAHLALQELANLGFTQVLFTPGQIDSVTRSTLQQLYTAGGAKPTTKSHYTDYLPTSLERRTPSYWEKLATAKEKKETKMVYDLSNYEKTDEPFENIIDDLMYYEKLLHAAQTNDVAMLEQALQAGVNPNARDETSGKTALMYAAQAGHIDIINALIKHKGTNPDLQETFNGRTALIYAARGGHPHLIEYLITYAHADANIEDKNGNTALVPLVTLTYPNNAEILRSLLSLGVFSKQAKETAALFARSIGRTDLVKLLESSYKTGQKAKL